MKKLWIVMAALVLLAATADATEEEGTAARTSLTQEPAGTEAVAMELLEAMKQGDVAGFTELLDLEALHTDATAGQEDQPSLEAFVKDVREAVEKEFSDGPATNFEYEVLGTVTVVKVKVRTDTDAEWQEHGIAFAQKNGEWTITAEGMKALDFGFSPRGPISRHAVSAADAMKKLLEAVEKGDADTIVEYIDLKGIYESIPEEYRGHMKFEDWEKEARDEMKKEIKPEEGFIYEILSAEEKGDKATVTVKTKEKEDAEWEERTIILKKINGTWKLTIEGMQAMGE